MRSFSDLFLNSSPDGADPSSASATIETIRELGQKLGVVLLSLAKAYPSAAILIIAVFVSVYLLRLLAAHKSQIEHFSSSLRKSNRSLQTLLRLTDVQDESFASRHLRALEVGVEFFNMEFAVYLEFAECWKTVLAYPSHVAPRHSIIEDLVYEKPTKAILGGYNASGQGIDGIPNWLLAIDPKARVFAACPIHSGSNHPGLAVFYSRSATPREFYREEIELLILLGQFMGSELSRARSEQELSASRVRMTGFIAAVDDIACEIDFDGNILYLWTKGTQKKQVAAAFDENHCGKLFGKSAEEKFKSAIKTSLNTNRPVVFEFHGNGTLGEKNFSARLSPSLAMDGTPRSIACLIRETTQQKLAEMRFRQALRRQSYYDLAAGVVNQINDPLQIIAGHARHLERHSRLGKFHEPIVQQSISKIKDMTGKISKIVDVIHRHVDGSEVTFTSSALGDIIFEVYRTLQTRFQSANVRFQLSSTIADDQFLYCRPTRIKEALINLCINSLKAVANSNSPWVNLEATDRDDQIEISVTDSGSYKPRLDIENMDRYGTNFHSDEMGIGLTICQQIAEEHRGQIFFDQSSKTTRIVMIFPKPVAEILELVG